MMGTQVMDEPAKGLRDFTVCWHAPLCTGPCRGEAGAGRGSARVKGRVADSLTNAGMQAACVAATESESIGPARETRRLLLALLRRRVRLIEVEARIVAPVELGGGLLEALLGSRL